MQLTQTDIDQIAEATAALVERRREPFIIPPEQHFTDHQFIQAVQEQQDDWRDVVAHVRTQQAREEMRRRNVHRIRNQIVGGVTAGGLLIFLGWLGTVIVEAVQSLARGG